VRQPAGYRAFYPEPLPPRNLRLADDLLRLLSRADMALGTLVGATEILPNPDLFLLMYVRREAVLSSQIEGTEASLMDILEFEAEQLRAERALPIHEVSNYIDALRYGLVRLSTLPLSLRLIREIHLRLMKGVRGGQPGKTPGEFRRSQNWVGGPSPMTARYVPPPVPVMREALADFETFLHDTRTLPTLVHIGLAHAQFETIHPFLDGNGRVGRLLISVMLSAAGVLNEPLLYLSIFFKEHRQDYYDRLQAIREAGEWEAWLAFFLEGVATVASEATETARRIVRLADEARETITAKLGRRSGNGLRLLDHLFEQPVVTVKTVQSALRISQPASAALVRQMEGAGILEETTGRRRDRIFRFARYLELFGEREQRG
jgi:Fic family protein